MWYSTTVHHIGNNVLNQLFSRLRKSVEYLRLYSEIDEPVSVFCESVIVVPNVERGVYMILD